MEQYTITFIPSGKPSFIINLYENDEHRLSIDRIIEQSNKSYSIFSNLSYEIQLSCSRLSDVQNVIFYVNDCFEQCYYHDGHIRFPAKGGGNRKIFLDCYGFVEIEIVLQLNDGTEIRTHSDYLPVLVKRGSLNDSVKAMADYIYNNQQELLFNGELKPKNVSTLKESDYKSLESQIILLEEIAAIYEESYGYFKANCRFKVEKVDVVDRLEKLQYITSRTLRYTVQHPEQLRQVSGTIGIQILGRTYHPERTLTPKNTYSKDIYENRVIVGFIKTMVSSVQQLVEKIDELLKNLPYDDKVTFSDYVYSPSYLFSGTKKLLTDSKKKLETTLGKFELLWGIYSSIMPIVSEQIESSPKPSAIFLSVPQYNKIFICIYKWFSFGIYNFSKENFMLTFIKISFLYESYLMAKLINYFKASKLELIETSRCIYPISDRWKYKNTTCNNTFIFKNSQIEITLFYQPVIFDSNKSNVNGIGLYRNNTLSINKDTDEERRGHYYVPDFLIKIVANDIARYIICDAKFSSLSTVKSYYIPDLTYKYLFSITPSRSEDILSGLCIIYGQCTESDVLKSIYDKQLNNTKILPFAEILPLLEGVQDCNHFRYIEEIIGLA